MRRPDDSSKSALVQAAAVPDIGAAWIPRRKATLITYEKGAIELRDRPTGRLIAWYEPGLVIAELPDLVALFSSPPDAWFAPRIRGILMEAEYAIRRGRVTPRDMYKALGQMLGRPGRAGEIFRANPVRFDAPLCHGRHLCGYFVFRSDTCHRRPLCQAGQ